LAYVTPQQYGFSLPTNIPGGVGNPMIANNPYFQNGKWTVPAGGWNNQNAPRPSYLGVDALYSMAGQPGAAAQHYGFSTDPNSPYYILGDRYLGKLQADWAKGIKTGGNEQIHKILTGLGTSKTGSKQAFVKADPNLGSKFAQYFKTGNAAAAGLTPARAKQAYDYALRATGRDAVLDRQPGMLGGLLKGNIGALAGTALGAAVPGLGMALGGALGGAIQGGVSGGLKGAALGGLSGYGIGSGGAWLAGKAGNLATNLGASSLGSKLTSAAAAKNGFLSNLWSQPAGTAKIIQRSSPLNASGYSARHLSNLGAANAASGSNTLSKAVIDAFGDKAITGAGSFINSSATPLQQALSGFGGTAATGGSSISNALSGAVNMKNLSQLGKLGAAGISAYNYFNPVTGNSQQNQLEAKIASLFGNGANQFRPYNVTTPMSQITFDGQNLNVSPSQGAMDQSNRYMELMEKAGEAASNVDTAGQSVEFYNQLNALKGLQEADEMRRLESVLFNQGGVHTGTANQVADFQSRLDAARQSRQFDAINSALAYQGDLYDQFQGLGRGAIDFNAGLFNPYAQAGTQAGAYATQADLTAKGYLAELADNSARVDYFDDRRERDYLNDALKFGFDFLGGL